MADMDGWLPMIAFNPQTAKLYYLYILLYPVPTSVSKINFLTHLLRGLVDEKNPPAKHSFYQPK